MAEPVCQHTRQDGTACTHLARFWVCEFVGTRTYLCGRHVKLRKATRHRVSPPATRECNECGEEKRLDEFTVDHSNAFGRKRTCKLCDNLKREKAIVYTTCSRCGQSGHTRASADCPEHKPRTGGKWCALCGSLAHRVLDDVPEWARVGRKCRQCGLAYAPEAEKTIEEVLAEPRENRKALG